MPSSTRTSPMAPKSGSSDQTQSTPPTSPATEAETKAEDGNDAADEVADEVVSSAMREEEQKMAELGRKEEEKRERRLAAERQKDIEGGKDAVDSKFKALEFLLSQSKLYSTIMLSQIEKQEEADNVKDEKERKRVQKKEEMADKAAQASQRRSTRTAAGEKEESAPTAENNVTQSQGLPSRPKGRVGRPPKLKKEASGKITDYIKKQDLEQKAGKGLTVQDALEEEAAHQEESGVQASDIGVQKLRSARQPELVSGGMMRSYQLEGLDWLRTLYENGLNGILADEMGLGKTIQTISFLAFLREKGIYGPFLIAAPLSTTSNWIDEFKRWTPSIPVVLYHGSKQDREEIRRKRLRNPSSEAFPVIVTSYEICMNDRKYLAHYGWKYIIIDEGHRIKNLNCRLIRELQSYQSANRLLITGTPLQNNLAELWSLLHFLMPDIFDKLESFESWFDFSALKDKGGHEEILSAERKSNLVTSLHAILKPFLLRRIKADVEHSMPKKREYVLYAPLTQEQRELYQEILSGNSRSYLEDKVFESISRTASGASTPAPTKGKVNGLKRKADDTSRASTPAKSAKTSRASTPATNGTNASRGRKGKRQRNYEEISDSKFFKRVANGAYDDDSADQDGSEDEGQTQREKTLALAKKQIAQKKLQNPVMQLRLCCNSTHNFYDPFPDTGDDELNSADVDYNVLLSVSGKMQLLDRLLDSLMAKPAKSSKKADDPHKILIFSQFKTQLDLLELYFSEIRQVPACRIDGSVAATDRSDQIRLFNESAEHRIFLLSTRAGGQGINLAAADTVVLFDSDWNPQQDLQAQDRAHRIGQRRNVIVYRLATKGTVEDILLSKAEGKRRLEKLVIRKGKFRSWSGKGRKSGGAGDTDEDEEDEDISELRDVLGREDGEKFDTTVESKGRLLSDKELKILTDRSDEAYERAEKGLDAAGAAFRSVETRKDGDGLLENMAG